MICPFFDFPTYLFYVADAPPLLYYSHVPTIFISLFVGIFVFLNGKRFLLNQLLLGISIFFSLWTIVDLITWTNINSDSILFVWSLLGLIFGFIAILSIYFIYVFLEKKDILLRTKIIFLLLLSPIFLLSSTDYNLAGFNLTDCDAFKFENIFFQTYYILLGVLAMIWILVLLVRHYRKSTVGFRKELVLIGVGIESFLFVFFILSYLGSYLTTIGLLKDSRVEMYGLFGMTFFISLVSYIIVKFKAFEVKLIGSQALVWALVILIGAEFFFIQSNVNRILTAITLVLAAIMGLIIVRSVKKEIAQREELAVANENQQLLIRFITHQVKGFFTKSKMVFASILEGDVGDASEPLKNLVKEGLESDNKAVEMVQEVLKASSLRSGTMTYNLEEANLSDFVREIGEGFRDMAVQKGLKYDVTVPTELVKVKIDKLQMTQVFKNLIDNSVKYTPTGYVKVSLNVKPDTVLFEIHDSGVGLSDSDKAKLFKEGGRGEESLKVNVNSTGYGLFIVKKIVEGHNGKIWAESAGRSHGSQFYVELPVIK